MGTEVFPRIKIGVGAPEHPDFDMKDYVLGKFSKEEVDILVKAAIRVTDAVEEMIVANPQQAMSKYNG